MREALERSIEELKRIDHLIYVTLKYTRTVDVLISVIDRMINAYEFAVDALFKYALETNMIDKIPEVPVTKAQKITDIFDNPVVIKNTELYQLFRKLKKVSYERENEYRRHVTMRATIEGKPVEINIDNITEYYHFIKKLVDFVYKKVIEK
ncbi:hypothetical protein JW930_04025 [Candidatus Woesearchaeota archaeon]|nr:hypothetical protein [Candidatus Woesearchaeota archaeon]